MKHRLAIHFSVSYSQAKIALTFGNDAEQHNEFADQNAIRLTLMVCALDELTTTYAKPTYGRKNPK
jgi:hypothetical protein